MIKNACGITVQECAERNLFVFGGEEQRKSIGVGACVVEC